jgi:UDP-2-acetamido-3-amino-2,3-dideoxy-glucuronate N-acetyltransferase
MAADYFVHEQGLCETEAIGAGTRIWAFAHVLEGARVGSDCNICDGVFVEGGAVIGDRVTVKCGVQLPNATFTNDLLPRSRQWLDEHPRTIVRKGASIGANATILPGLEVGTNAMVGAGAVVTRPVPPNAVVVGNPARIQGYVSSETATAEAVEPPGEAPGKTPLAVRGAHLQRFPGFADLRGSLTAGEVSDEEMPFAPQRWFLVYDVPGREVRGEHAHRICDQFLICVHGSVQVAVDDGERRAEVSLDDPTLGIYIPAGIWASQYRYDGDAVLLVLASHPYDPDDYIRDYGTFLEEVSSEAES